MRFHLSLLFFCLLLGGQNVYASPCSRVKSREDAWVAARVNQLILAARAAYESDDAEEAYSKVLTRIASTISQCKLAEDEGFISRYREFLDYIEAASLDKQPGHELGFIVPDKQYFEETREYVQIPEFLLNRSFLRAVSRYETLDRAKSYLRQLNSGRDSSAQLIFFSYQSRHLGTPDNNDSFRRLLIIVPGNAPEGVPEKWVQFGVTDPGARTRVRNVSVVSAIARQDGTSNIYFKDFFRTYRRNGTISIKGRWELGEGDDNCAQCHKSGILPIFPVANSVSPVEEQALQAANERFLTYGSPRFENYLDETKFGPGLGSAQWQERSHRFGAGFEGTTISHAMTCGACHTSDRLGSLNWPMDKTIVNSFVTGGQMPMGYTLKAKERLELYRKLIQEYFAINEATPGILKSWLLGKLR